VAALLAASGVLVSASRTGLVATAGSFALWVLLHYRLRREFTLFAAGCCLIGVVAIGFLHIEWWGGMNVVGRLEEAASPTGDSNVEWRLAQYDAVIRRSLQSPLVGFGLSGDQSGVYGELVHNMYLRVLHGGGILALAGLLIVLGDLSYRGFKLLWSPIDYELKAFAVAYTTGAVALMLAGLTDTWLYQRSVWVPGALLFALWALPRDGRQRSRRSRKRSSRRRAPAEPGRLTPDTGRGTR
jgi:O-antigen ligase